MQWDRRAFVKFAVGAGLGLASSPLMLKLTDDVAIWTQNWSWVPNPEDGELAFANIVNPATGTAARARIVRARVDGDRAVRIEGNFDHPLCAGGVVPEDASSLQLLYNKALRAPAPMVREMNSRTPRQVSAEDAVSFVAKVLNNIKKQKYQPTVAMVGDESGGTVADMLKGFASSYGTPNLAFTPTAADTLRTACRIMFGQEEVGFDLMNADFVISFGTPLLEGFGAPVATRKAFAKWRDNAKASALVQVENRASVTAGQADMWLACKPGSEAVVALGIANILIREGAYDKALVDGAPGFEDMEEGPGFKSMVLNKYTPEKVAALAGVKAKDLIGAATAFAESDKGLAVCGPDNAGGPGRLYDFLSVLSLNALKGNLGKPGGLVVREPLPLASMGEVKPVAIPSFAGSENLPLKSANLDVMAKGALLNKPYPLYVLIIVNTNPVFSGPQAEVMKSLVENAPFTVAITPFMDETAKMADVVLPTGLFMESWGDSVTPYGAAQSSYGIHRPLVNAIPDALSAGDWLLAIRKAMGEKDLPETMMDLLQARTEGMGDFEELVEKSFWVQEKPAYGQFELGTESGKVEFFATGLHKTVSERAGKEMPRAVKALGVEAPMEEAFLPHYEPSKGLAGVGPEFPLVMTAIPSLRTPGGQDPISPYMIKILYDTTLAEHDKLVVEINPATAKDYKLKEGDLVTLTSAFAELKAKVHLFAGAAPGVVYVPRGLGHTAGGVYLTNIGENYHRAVQVTADAMSGQPDWEYTPVRMAKAKEAAHV